MNIELLKQELRRDEGVRTTAYQDSLGLWTIGVGHLLPPGDHAGLVWAQSQVDQQFALDVNTALTLAQSLAAFGVCGPDARQRALCNMSFQLGHKLASFNTFLSLLQQQKWAEAAKDLRTTLWYKETPVRAERICKMIEQG